ncbi:MAG TPA: peptidoglycan recognition family protein [Candidatus Saccharimonadia bacterium]|nr:peptidoglycan recognition family protein [Candidatus Saccharimonadia bacterium]
MTIAPASYIRLVLAVTLTISGLLAPAISFASPPPDPAPATSLQFKASGKTAASSLPLPQLRALAGRGAGPSAAITPTAPSLLNPRPECPPGLTCKFVPAAYQQDDPADPSNYGNYDLANRPSGGLRSQPGVGLAINSVVIHDTEGSLANTLAVFQDPTQYRSAHYVIDTDGTVYQMIQTKNVAWHAGNWYVNEHSIGIEHVGHAAQGGTEYTPAMYRSSALLVRYLASRFNIPLDRQHIVGHDNVSAPIPGLMAGMHYDPGPFWNWQYYQALLGIPVVPTAALGSPLVTIAPNWPINQPPTIGCAPDGSNCAPLPKQPANFVYLHTAPSDTAPLLSDAALHPDGSPGTIHIDDWSATAAYGQQFALADHHDDWTAIWYAGQKAWFRNPAQILAALPTRGQLIKPRADLASIPVYGRAYPEAAAYAGKQVPVQAIMPIQYTIPAGQAYATTGPVPTDYYWSWYIDASFNPDDHTVIVGTERYLEIQLGHRTAYVKASDVDISTN